MVLLIDNYDSFTWNLAQAVGALGPECRVVRNDQLTVADIEAGLPAAIVISPGPRTPVEAGISVELVERLSGKVPLLGVCLGHQAIAAAHGGRVVRAERMMHGKISEVHHAGGSIFSGIPNPFDATRYHSLVVERETLPEVLEIIAWTDEGDEGVIQGIRHRAHSTWGVQFHPESVGTAVGDAILRNFLDSAGCL